MKAAGGLRAPLEFNLTGVLIGVIHIPVEGKPFWSVSRRKYLAGKLGELSLLLVAGGILSDVFVKLNTFLKLGLIIFAATLLIVSIPVYPDKEEEK